MNRQAILLASLAAAIPGAAGSFPALAAPGSSQPLFAPPANGVLTRTVWRYLSDGQQIVVTRRYAVRFEPSVEGFRLEGALIDATVNAPADLAAFAELERNRPDTTMFPIVLDPTGRVLSDGTLPSPDTAQRTAALVHAALGTAKIASDTKAEALRQAPLLAAGNGGATPVPADLFQSRPGSRSESRKIALPGGMEGEVEVAVKVERDRAGAMPRQVERVVTTRLAGTTKVSREVWSFSTS